MNKRNIEQIVRELFRKNFELYPDSYPLTETGFMTDEGSMCAQDWAKDLYEHREEGDIERDKAAGVTEIDYVEWVMAELSELIPEAICIISATELPTELEGFVGGMGFKSIYTITESDLCLDVSADVKGYISQPIEGIYYAEVMDGDGDSYYAHGDVDQLKNWIGSKIKYLCTE